MNFRRDDLDDLALAVAPRFPSSKQRHEQAICSLPRPLERLPLKFIDDLVLNRFHKSGETRIVFHPIVPGRSSDAGGLRRTANRSDLPKLRECSILCFVSVEHKSIHGIPLKFATQCPNCPDAKRI